MTTGPAATSTGRDDGDDDRARFRTAWWQRLLDDAPTWRPRGDRDGRGARDGRDDRSTYEATRFVVLRLLAFVYMAAFGSLALQLDPLLGSRGLLPIHDYVGVLHARLGAAAFYRLPSLFFFASSDTVLHVAAWTGLALSVAALAGVTNAALQLVLWLLYMSFVHVGQIFYGYGWEIQLLETGFLAVFLCPWRSLRAFPQTAAPRVVVWLLRWLIVRIMLGSALIKLRGDPCWTALTCLDAHFETQPNPNPLAWWMHHAPHAVHAAGVVFTLAVEGIAPVFVFGFRRSRHFAGALFVLLQASLVASGNLSFLNWLTIVPALACFDDTAYVAYVAYVRCLPRARRLAVLARFQVLRTPRRQTWAARIVAVVVALLSVGPVINLTSPSQAMNLSFDPLDLVNTYGAFGSVDRARHELILEGTSDASADGTQPAPDARWEEYELPCMPGDVRRRPCVVTPYHDRLDWQMWFVGNGVARGETIDREPWLVHLIWQLLRGDASPKALLARDPFPSSPPRWIRARIWRYRFSTSRADGAWWTRQAVGVALPPTSADDPDLERYVRAYGWR